MYLNNDNILIIIGVYLKSTILDSNNKHALNNHNTLIIIGVDLEADWCRFGNRLVSI